MEPTVDELGADGASQVRLARGHSAQQVAARDDAGDSAISDHRHALDPVRYEHARYLAKLGILAHCDNRRRHHGTRAVVLRLQPSKKLGGEWLAFSEHLQPGLTPSLAR